MFFNNLKKKIKYKLELLLSEVLPEHLKYKEQTNQEHTYALLTCEIFYDGFSDFYGVDYFDALLTFSLMKGVIKKQKIIKFR